MYITFYKSLLPLEWLTQSNNVKVYINFISIFD